MEEAQSGDMMFVSQGVTSRPRPGRDSSGEFDDTVRGLASRLLVGIPLAFTVDSRSLGAQDDSLGSLTFFGFSYASTLAAIYWS